MYEHVYNALLFQCPCSTSLGSGIQTSPSVIHHLLLEFPWTLEPSDNNNNNKKTTRRQQEDNKKTTTRRQQQQQQQQQREVPHPLSVEEGRVEVRNPSTQVFLLAKVERLGMLDGATVGWKRAGQKAWVTETFPKQSYQLMIGVIFGMQNTKQKL